LLAKPWSKTAKDFVHRINSIAFMYPDSVIRSAFNLLDSHDTDRFVTRMGSKDLAKLGLIMLFTLPGSPCIYYGTEYALEGGGDPDNRRCMIWEPTEDEQDFARFVTSLVKLRREYWQVFADGSRHYVVDPAHPGFLGITIKNGQEILMVLINRDRASIPEEIWKRLMGWQSFVPSLQVSGAGIPVTSLIAGTGLDKNGALPALSAVVVKV